MGRYISLRMQFTGSQLTGRALEPVFPSTFLSLRRSGGSMLTRAVITGSLQDTP
jgi:hypothetical protein